MRWPDFLQFSRSNFLFPSKQHFPHRAFNEETEYLNEQLGIAGDAFILGSLNGARWHLYIWDFNELPSSEYQQQTLEIVMFNLNTDRMKTFYNAGTPNTLGRGHPCGSGEEATKVSGIDRLLPGSVIDSHLFTPCGYSCNGRLDVKNIDIAAMSGKGAAVAEERKESAGASRVGKQGKVQQAYFTVHITPEPECSFVSFETNAVLPSYTALVRHVVELFQPGSFCVSPLRGRRQRRVGQPQRPLVGAPRIRHQGHHPPRLPGRVQRHRQSVRGGEARPPPPRAAVRRPRAQQRTDGRVTARRGGEVRG